MDNGIVERDRVTDNAEADLVGHWRLDGSAADSSGKGHDGEIYGDPKWVDGKIEGALEFDGDDWIEMPGTSAAEDFAALEGAVTWAAWFKTSSSGVINTLMAQGPTGAAHVRGNRSINVEASGVINFKYFEAWRETYTCLPFILRQKPDRIYVN